MAHRWPLFFAASRNWPPSPLLHDALRYCPARERALDLGAGALRDSKLLLALGFEVTAIDASPLIHDAAKEINSPCFHVVQETFDQFAFEPGIYDLVNASLALPFNPPGTFDAMFARLKDSLRPGGVFAGHFFGPWDEWNTGKSGMTFHTRDDIIRLLVSFSVLQLAEKEENVLTVARTMKHSHIFGIIAKKPRI